jgi:hypothetical protein
MRFTIITNLRLGLSQTLIEQAGLRAFILCREMKKTRLFSKRILLLSPKTTLVLKRMIELLKSMIQ